jgi:hypothetical protein
MAQGKSKNATNASKAKKSASSGAVRKNLGKTRKNLRVKAANFLRDAAGKSFITAIEGDMAHRLPSDQRMKLTVLRETPGKLVANKKRNLKKPLARGRKRK